MVMLFSTTVFAESSYSLDQKRIFGKDRYETSSLISKNGWESASSVVICNGENFPDALCAAPLAKKYNAPILLVSKSGLSESTKEELSRLNPDKLIIIGGNGVIPDKAISEIKTAAPKASDVTRLGGTTRYDTSKMIADKVGKSSSIVLVSGKASSDALSISYIAANKGMPILLADRKEDVLEYSKDNSVEKAYIIGGESLVSKDIESIFKNTERIYGKDRYESNQKILDKFKDDINFGSIYLASAQYNGVDQFADALSVSALASKDCNPIILVSRTIDKDTVSIIKSKVDKNSKVIAIGGTQLVSENIVTALVNVNSSNENDDQGNSGSSGGGGGGGSSSSNPFAGGSGTVSSPYKIATAAQLNKVRSYLNKNFILTADIDLSSYANWEPIGAFKPLSDKPEDEETPVVSLAFSGIFDGKGHKISNINISRSDDSAVGLFGCIAGDSAYIKNLVVENTTVSGKQLVGGVIGYACFENSVESVSLIGKNNITGGFLVGGVIGGGFCNIKSCSANADVTLIGNEAQGIGVLAGGMESGALIGCSATGTVTAMGNGNFSIGGLSGAAQESPSVENCNADVTMTVGENSLMVGGLVGHTGTYDVENPTLVKNCSANASIKAADSAERIGGIVGAGFYHDAYKDVRPIPTVYKVIDSETSGSIEGVKIVGTIAGYAYNSTVENCTSTMVVNGSADAQQIGKSETTEPSSFAGGSGTEADPYQIATADQLNNVRKHLDKHFKLTADIDLASYENWEPIGAFNLQAEDESGYLANAFKGSFNGDNHTISNLTTNKEDSVGVGLIGAASSSSVVKNLKMKNVTAEGTTAVGAVLGYNQGTVENITLFGDNNISGYNCIGGILGGNEGGAIKNCTAAATINVLGDNVFEDGRYILPDNAEAGGIIVGGSFTGTIDGCSAEGTVISKGSNAMGLGGVGGCLEYMESITNCTANVIIDAGESAHGVGGLCGFAGMFDREAPAVISNCTVTVTITANGATHIGGLVGTGLYMNMYDMESVFVISNCEVTAEIKGAITPGTVVGRAEGSTIESCTANVTIDGASDGPEIGTTDRPFESAE